MAPPAELVYAVRAVQVKIAGPHFRFLASSRRPESSAQSLIRPHAATSPVYELRHPSFLAARAANRTLGATYAQHARGRARAASRDEVAAGLLDELAYVPLGLMDAAHAILVQSSAGTDSLVQLHRIATWTKKAGCLQKVVVIHSDPDEESEWPGARELAQRQAERYGLRFHVLRAEGGMLGLVEKPGMWPDAVAGGERRLCGVAVSGVPVSEAALTKPLPEPNRTSNPWSARASSWSCCSL